MLQRQVIIEEIKSDLQEAESLLGEVASNLAVQEILSWIEDLEAQLQFYETEMILEDISFVY